jgi:hypothetical protein
MQPESGNFLFGQPLGRGDYVVFQNSAYVAERPLSQAFWKHQACPIPIPYEFGMIQCSLHILTI